MSKKYYFVVEEEFLEVSDISVHVLHLNADF